MIEKALTTKQRANLKDSQFGIPELRAYPLNDKNHVLQAIRMFNHVDSKYESELANNIKKAINRFNLDVTVGDENRFKKYFENIDEQVNRITESGIVEEKEQFEKNAEKFKNYLTSHYKFVKSVDLDISSVTKYVSNFFISVDTSLSGFFPERSVAEFNLDSVVIGSTTHYGIGGPEDTEVTQNDLVQGVSNLFYKDAIKCGLVPVVNKNRYSIMKYNNDSYYYHGDRDSAGNLKLRLEFYTDRGVPTAKESQMALDIMVNKILEGADITRTLMESTNKRPVELGWFIQHFEDEAVKAGYDTSKFAKQARERYTKDVYHSLMRSLKPQGFDKKFYRQALSGDLSSFYANEIKVDQYCPKDWRDKVVRYLVDSLTNDEQTWIDSRYEFTNKAGKTFIKNLW